MRLQGLMIYSINPYRHHEDDTYIPQFITFTFRENMTDVTEANLHFKNLIKRLNYYLKAQEKREVKYLNVIEFQKRGSVHFHTVFFNLPLIDIKEERKTRHFAKLWRHGFIETKHAKVREGLTGYLTKYLTKDNMDERLIARKKYFCSRGLKKEQVFTHQEFAQSLFMELSSFEPSFETMFTLNNNEIKYKKFFLSDDEVWSISFFKLWSNRYCDMYPEE